MFYCCVTVVLLLCDGWHTTWAIEDRHQDATVFGCWHSPAKLSTFAGKVVYICRKGCRHLPQGCRHLSARLSTFAGKVVDICRQGCRHLCKVVKHLPASETLKSADCRQAACSHTTKAGSKVLEPAFVVSCPKVRGQQAAWARCARWRAAGGAEWGLVCLPAKGEGRGATAPWPCPCSGP